MEIKVDTSIMHQMASRSLRAKELLEEAIRSAKAVASHNDWNCLERDSIDDGILQVQKNNELMGENMEAFAKRLNEIAEQFDQFEREIVSKFAVVDSMVGDLYRVKTHGSANISFPVAQSLPRNIQTESYWDRYHSANLFRPVTVVPFQETSVFLGKASSDDKGVK